MFPVVPYQKFKMFLLVPGLDLLPVNREIFPFFPLR